MNEPTTVTYSIADILKRIEDKIDGNQKELKQEIKDVNTKLDTIQKEITQKIDKQSEEIGTFKTEIGTIKATLQGQQPLVQKIPDLAEKVGELKNWRQLLIITVTATVSGIIGWFVRGGNLKP
jgi:predicted  nucleic acid-binding Zn-ribbon protein